MTQKPESELVELIKNFAYDTITGLGDLSNVLGQILDEVRQIGRKLCKGSG
ncbi:MAG: hypothetical protein ACFFD8_05295 [Candidatus Thorarchaeota archaeon]